jgi:hypothetical protein
VTKILKAMAFGSAGGEGQNRIQSVESLDSALSSTQKTAALTGGLRYKPMMSAAFSSNLGSSLSM